MIRYLTLSAIGVAAAAGVAFWMTSTAPNTSGLPTVGTAQAQSADIDTSAISDMALGSADAPVTIIEYASFTCPHCATFHDSAFKQIKENYVDTGKVRFVHREVFFDRYGLWASMVARCGGDMRYFGIIDMVYDQQREWTQGEPGQIADNLRRIGLTAGLDEDTLNACLSDAATAETLYAWYQENAEADDINSTPSFIIDGRKYSNMSYTEFSELLDEKLGE